MTKDKLLNGCPAIYENGTYVVFSPFTGKIARVANNGLDEFAKELAQPKCKGRNDTTDTIRAVFVVTTDCNLRCPYCFVPQKGQYMDPELAINYLNALKTPTTKTVKIGFFGGEPTLGMDFIKAVVNYCKQNFSNCKFNISTNGMTSKQNLQYLVDNDFDINISYDGPASLTGITRPLPTGKDSSCTALQSIKFLLESGANIRVRSTVTKDFVEKLPQIVEFLAQNNIHSVHFEPVKTDNVEERIPVDTFLKYFKKAYEVTKDLDSEVFTSAFTKLFLPSSFYCSYCGKNKFVLYPDGTLSKCIEVGPSHNNSSTFCVGKMKKTPKINTNQVKVLGEINNSNTDACKECFAKYICSGGCPLRNLESTGNFYDPDKYYCDLNRKLLRFIILEIAKETNI